MKKCLSFTLFIVLFLSIPLFAQEKIDGWQVFNTSNSVLPNNHVRDLAFDRKGHLWIGTWGGALARYKQDDGSWKLYNQANSEIPGSYINQIDIASDGKIWIVAKEGFGSFDGNENWESVKMPAGVEGQSIAVNSSGVALIGTVKDGLYIYSKDKILSKIWGEKNDIEAGVTDIDFDQAGNALVCTRGGLLRFSKVPGGMFTSVHKKIAEFHCVKVEFDKKNEVIWVIDGDQKMAEYNGKRWKTYRHTAPNIYMSPNGGTETYSASELCSVDSKRFSLAIGTYFFGGLAVFGGKFWGAIYTPYSDVRMTGSVEALAQDKRGALWVGTLQRGVMVRVGEDVEDIVKEVIELTEEEMDLPEEEKTALIEKRKEQKKMVRTRVVEVKDTVYSKTREVEISIWDAQKVDGDTISLMLNGKFVLENYALKKHPKKIRVTLKDNNNSLVLYAHNLGTIPPNTATISITDLGKQREIHLMADKQNSQSVIVIHDVFETIAPVIE